MPVFKGQDGKTHDTELEAFYRTDAYLESISPPELNKVFSRGWEYLTESQRADCKRAICNNERSGMSDERVRRMTKIARRLVATGERTPRSFERLTVEVLTSTQQKRADYIACWVGFEECGELEKMVRRATTTHALSVWAHCVAEELESGEGNQISSTERTPQIFTEDAINGPGGSRYFLV